MNNFDEQKNHVCQAQIYVKTQTFSNEEFRVFVWGHFWSLLGVVGFEGDHVVHRGRSQTVNFGSDVGQVLVLSVTIDKHARPEQVV